MSLPGLYAAGMPAARVCRLLGLGDKDMVMAFAFMRALSLQEQQYTITIKHNLIHAYADIQR